MRLRSFITTALIVLLPLTSFASTKKEIILGFGLGYSGALDSTLIEWEYDFTERNEMYFKEKGEMKNNKSVYAQYFFTHRLGLELEFRQQNASYFSHLEWFGRWIPDPLSPNVESYMAINHIEEPYWKDWSLSSLTLCFVYAQRQYLKQRFYLHLFAGFGFYFINADEDLVLNRWKLGPKKSRECMKLGGGLKYRFGSKLTLNLKVFGEFLVRGKMLGSTNKLYVGYDQFDLIIYMEENKIVRSGYRNIFARSFTYGGINLSLEFRL